MENGSPFAVSANTDKICILGIDRRKVFIISFLHYSQIIESFGFLEDYVEGQETLVYVCLSVRDSARPV